MDNIIEKIRGTLKPVFALKEIGRLTGGDWHPRTVANGKSSGQIPAECFGKKGRTTLVIRDAFRPTRLIKKNFVNRRNIMGMKMYDIDGTREYADKNRGVKASLSWWYKQIVAGKGPRGRKIAGKWYFNESDIGYFYRFSSLFNGPKKRKA